MSTHTAHVKFVLAALVILSASVALPVYADSPSLTDEGAFGTGLAPTEASTESALEIIDVNPSVSDTPVVVTRVDAVAQLEQNPEAAYVADDLHSHATLLAAKDENISSIAFSSEKVVIDYKTPAKLLGIIDMQAPVTVAVDAHGNTSVEYPWYGFLLNSNQVQLFNKMQVGIDALYATSTIDASALTTDQQVALLDRLHAILQTEVARRDSASF